jgi:hypothetical protein
MLTRALLCLLLSSAAIAQTQSPTQSQTQYGTAPKAPSPAPVRTTCPWLTPGTVANFLNGDVSVTVKMPNPGEGSCAFTRQQGSAAYTLEVLVQKAALPACPPGSDKLIAIGNEAARCRTQPSPTESVEMVSFRVRDLYSTISLTIRGTRTPDIPPDKQRDALEQITEQVAGNLY